MYECSQVAESSDPYVDGELPASVRAQVQHHIRGCAECAANIYQAGALKRLVRASVRNLTVPVTLRDNLRIRMET
jgi:anti-sigma factor (TIGR02949 family)